MNSQIQITEIHEAESHIQITVKRVKNLYKTICHSSNLAQKTWHKQKTYILLYMFSPH